MTRVVDDTLVKIMSWYDNEWGFAHQMIREALSVLDVSPRSDRTSSTDIFHKGRFSI